MKDTMLVVTLHDLIGVCVLIAMVVAILWILLSSKMQIYFSTKKQKAYATGGLVPKTHLVDEHDFESIGRKSKYVILPKPNTAREQSSYDLRIKIARLELYLEKLKMLPVNSEDFEKTVEEVKIASKEIAEFNLK